MKRVLALSLLAAFASLALAAGPPARRYRTEGIRIAVESSLRVTMLCDDQPLSYGSAVAVGPRDVVTARHVAEITLDVIGRCEQGKQIHFTGFLFDGTAVELVVTKLSDDADLAVMSLLSDAAPFHTWARLVARPPAIGDDLWVSSGHYGPPMNPLPPTLRPGVYYGETTEDGPVGRLVLLSMHVVHGNSGAGVFDERGRVVGIVKQLLIFDGEDEFAAGATPADMVATLLASRS